MTLIANNGTITLGGIAGLGFSLGDGTSDTAMTFSANLGNINAALQGLSFAPNAGFNGAASLQILTNDLGNFGTGGAMSDTDPVGITVGVPPSVPPVVTPISGATAKTGARAAGLKKCKKKRGQARRNCIKRAKKLPV